MKLHSISLIALLSFLSCCSLYAQTDLSAQVQLYPTGIIPGVKIDHSISHRGRLSLRLGANIFDHRDLGVQNEEEGSGFGFSFGYQHYFNDGYTGLHIEFKNDVWWNSVDWQTDNLSGQTDILVLQPTVSLGYTKFMGSFFFIAPSVGFGWEWNVRTNGLPTGEGAIGLLGLSVGVRLH